MQSKDRLRDRAERLKNIQTEILSAHKRLQQLSRGLDRLLAQGKHCRTVCCKDLSKKSTTQHLHSNRLFFLASIQYHEALIHGSDPFSEGFIEAANRVCGNLAIFAAARRTVINIKRNVEEKHNTFTKIQQLRETEKRMLRLRRLSDQNMSQVNQSRSLSDELARLSIDN